MRLLLCLLAPLLLAMVAQAATPPKLKLTHRWFYVGGAPRDRAGVERMTTLFDRAEKAGYNGFMLGGVNAFNQSPEYLEVIRAFRQAAEEHHLGIYPYVVMHNSGTVLGRDPNLAEGLPVKDAPFVVHGQEATLASDLAAGVANGGFEQAEGDKLAGWTMQDKPGESTFVDRAVAHSGGASLRVEWSPGNKDGYRMGRVMQPLQVHPFRQYHVTLWVKTDGFRGEPNCVILPPTQKERYLMNLEERVSATQDWTRYDLLFNSLEWNEARLYVGVWGGREGRFWVDDVSVEEVGLLNPLRREGTPLTVRGEDGKVYQEGVDYEPVRDPQLAAYPTYHVPLSLRLTAASHIPDGARLRVSYYHPIHLENYIVSCLSEPKVYDILREQLVKINDLLHPAGFMMSDDEIRVANWDATCEKTGLTPGQQLAAKARRCTKMIEELRPDAELWDWSDMFDPMHNAVGDYYAVNGSWAGSWEGLAPEVGIINWANHLEGKNLKFFADRGHRQILAGYYDGGGYPIDKWLAAGEGLPGIVGAMYTTWRNDYSQLEAFAEQAWGK